MAFKEKALKRMTEKLNAAGVVWAMGAGWLLTRLGISPDFHDFDIMVSPEWLEKADKVLTRMGMKSAPEQEGSSFRCSYHFDGADVHLHSGLVLRRGDEAWPIRFDASSVMEKQTILGVDVPLMYPEDMLVFYALEGRMSRVKELTDWFATHPSMHLERFALAVEGELPEDVKAIIKAVSGGCSAK